MKIKYRPRKVTILTGQFTKRASHERPMINLDNLLENELLCKYSNKCKKDCPIQLTKTCQVYKFKEKYNK